MKTFKEFKQTIMEDGEGTGDVSTNCSGTMPDVGGVAKIDPLLDKKKILKRPAPKLI